MEFKGTKGDWSLKVHDDMYNAFILNNQILPTKYKEEEYNAKLMETAPEMLEMLFRIAVDEHVDLNEVKDLIKKATTI